MYQPSPFKGDVTEHVRSDCEARYRVIRKWTDGVEGKEVLDFGCAEGYMGFRFIQDGAKHCLFIDNDQKCLHVIDERAKVHEMMYKVTVCEEFPGIKVDIGLLLDLYSEPGVPDLKTFKEFCTTLFVSTSGDGQNKNYKLLTAASNVFQEVIPIYTGYQGRTIYRCR
jgi:hypothetical protein